MSEDFSHKLEAKHDSLIVVIALSVMLPQTTVWYFGYYSTQAYLVMMGMLLLMLFVYSKEKTHPHLSQLFLSILMGIFPALTLLVMPEYHILVICFHFICLQAGMTDLKLSKAPILLLSNAVAWIFYYFYHYYFASSEGEIQVSFIRRDPSAIPQLLFGFFLNSFQLGSDIHKKFCQRKLREEYEQRLVSLNKELEEANSKLQLANQELKAALDEKENFILRFSHEIRNPLNSLLGNIDLCNEYAKEHEELLKMLKDAKISGEILLQLLNNVLDTAKVSVGRLEISPSPHNVHRFLERSWVVCSEIIRKKGLYGCLTLSPNVPEILEFDHHRLMQILINMTSNGAKFTEKGFVKIFVDFYVGQEVQSEHMCPKYTKMHEEFVEDSSSLECLDSEELVDKPVFDAEHLLGIKRSIEAKFNSYIKDSARTAGCLRMSPQSTDQPAFNKEPSERVSRDGFIRLEIVDSGCGMKKEDIESLFEKFRQVNDDSSKRQIGTGLGLWITKELIELMKGKIEIHSEFKVGTTIVIMLKSKSKSKAKATSSSPSSSAKVGKGKIFRLSTMPQKASLADLNLSNANDLLSIKRALIVEDNPYNQEVNKKFLTKCSIPKIRIANNGKEAVDLILSKRPGYFDLVLMDIDMPIMDGKEAVKLIRQEETKRGWPALFIVFLTAYSESKTRGELLDPLGQYRANGFIAKPASVEMIQAAIRDCFQKMRAPSLEVVIPFKPLFSKKNTLELNETILIVDDDSFNLSMITKMIAVCGYRALEARNGLAAVELYNENWRDINIVLMDCEMPVMNGWEATKKILEKYRTLALESQKELMIYGLTGHVGKEYRQKCLEVGMREVLEKPITIDGLRNLLHKNVVLAK